MSSRRRRAREAALKALYQIDLTGIEVETSIRDVMADEVYLPAFESFARDFLISVAPHRAEGSPAESFARAFSHDVVVGGGAFPPDAETFRAAVLKAASDQEYELGGCDAAITKLFRRCSEKVASFKDLEAFTRTLVSRTVEHRVKLDELLSRFTDNWSLDRMASLDRSILRYAVCELLHFRDIPINVTINEAIELARKYSTDRSCEFVNGVLDKISREIKPEKDDPRARKEPPETDKGEDKGH